MGFTKGVSGNPSGRPRGVVNQLKLRESIVKDLPDILTAMVKAAKDGDTTAARLLLDRTIAPLKSTDQAAPLPLGEGLAGASAAVLQSLATGTLTPDQASSLAAALSGLSRVQEVVDLAARVAALEEKHHEQLN